MNRSYPLGMVSQAATKKNTQKWGVWMDSLRSGVYGWIQGGWIQGVWMDSWMDSSEVGCLDGFWMDSGMDSGCLDGFNGWIQGVWMDSQFLSPLSRLHFVVARFVR